MTKTKRRLPIAVKVLVVTFVTISFWISFEVYRALTVEPISEVPSEILTPLDPRLDVDTLDKLKNRIYLSEEEIGNLTVMENLTVEEEKEEVVDESAVEEPTEEIEEEKGEEKENESG